MFAPIGACPDPTCFTHKKERPMSHACAPHTRFSHPLPPEDPDKLQGPEVGEFVMYQPDPLTKWTNGPEGRVKVVEERPAVVVRVIKRSYVWSPGECSSRGGYRHYDWSVIEEGPDEFRAVVVNDDKLSPLPVDPWSGKPKKVGLAYVVRP